jgi:ABC-type branched-subunit amino acid transport system ATPase component
MSAVLETEGLTAGYVPEVNILHDVEVHVDEGEIVTIVGPNGAGKSTLIKSIVGLVPLRGGRVRLRGDDVSGAKPHVIARKGVGYVPQLDNVFPSMTVDENLELGAIVRKERSVRERMAVMHELFPVLSMRRRQSAGNLSGGERQMVAMAKALMADPSILLLDEPSAGLAPLVVDLIFERVRAINESGVTIMMVEQNARRALALSDRGYVLDLGRNRFEGPGEDLLHDPKVIELYLGGTARVDRPESSEKTIAQE